MNYIIYVIINIIITQKKNKIKNLLTPVEKKNFFSFMIVIIEI